MVGSNIEQLGTELERKCKETAAATETEVHTGAPLCGPPVSRFALRCQLTLHIFVSSVAQDRQGAWPAHLESRELQGGASAAQDLRPLLRGRLLHRAQRRPPKNSPLLLLLQLSPGPAPTCVERSLTWAGVYVQTHGRPGSFLYDVHFWLGDSTTLVRPPPPKTLVLLLHCLLYGVYLWS